MLDDPRDIRISNALDDLVKKTSEVEDTLHRYLPRTDVRFPPLPVKELDWRTVEQGDIPALLDFLKDDPDPKAPFVESRQRRTLESVCSRDREGGCVVLSKSGEIIACGVFTIGVPDTVADIENIQVRSDFRRRGIGTWLTECMIQLAECAQFLEVELVTLNPAAEEMYRKIGFEDTGWCGYPSGASIFRRSVRSDRGG